MDFFGAFMSNKQRVISGFAMLGVILLIGFIDNFFLTWLFLGIVYVIAFSEAMRLFGLKNDMLLFCCVILWIIGGFYPYGDDLLILMGVGFAGAVAYNQKIQWKNFLPFLYPSAGMLFLLTLYREYGVLSLFWLLVVVAMSDVGAYTVGKAIGKRAFCKTSPNKTIEGVVGGIVVATIFGAFVGLSIVDFGTAFIISAFVSLSSIFGDLFESYLKRKAKVKDSGSIIPGHGGVLDRIDGYLFGGIVMLILLRGLV